MGRAYNRKSMHWGRRKGTKACTRGRLKSGACQKGCFGSIKLITNNPE